MNVPLLAILLFPPSATLAPVPQDPKATAGPVQAGTKGEAFAATSGGSALAASPSAPGQQLVGGTDDCATPEVITGPGPFAFDNSAATTGAEGQNEPLCNFYTIRGITNDVWFRWTSPASGTATLSLCAGTSGLDTKVAVYNGSGCPAGPAIACNDDACAFVTRVVFCATGGQMYTVQLGNYPSATGGTGSFTIQMTPPGVGNDDCATPTILAGPGPYVFDNATATTGCQGQGNTNCNLFGTPGIQRDLWYTWTAPASGLASITTCSQDRKSVV